MLSFISSASSLEPIDVSTYPSGKGINRYVEFHEDKYAELSLVDVAADKSQDKEFWSSHNADELSFGYTQSVFWFRFLVSNTSLKIQSTYWSYRTLYWMMSASQWLMYAVKKLLVK